MLICDGETNRIGNKLGVETAQKPYPYECLDHVKRESNLPIKFTCSNILDGRLWEVLNEHLEFEVVQPHHTMQRLRVNQAGSIISITPLNSIQPIQRDIASLFLPLPTYNSMSQVSSLAN
jgi:hypothetical protein